MADILANLQPQSVFHYFEEISKIPRSSGKEKAISDYVVAFAKQRGFKVTQDQKWNVIIKKPGTSGYENAAPVIIQGHLDMVCEKNRSTQHDFDIDPIKLQVKDDIIYAEGTTLGADNGVAIAYGLALLDGKDIPHPPLEVCFTTDEEVGLIGAAVLDASQLTGKTLINIDSEEEGILLVSCAGGMRAAISVPIQWEEADTSMEQFWIQIRGLKGGHSGSDIDKQRGNANKIMGRILDDLYMTLDFRIAEINGGAKDNAIPREMDCLVLIEKKEKDLLAKKIDRWNTVLKNELKTSDAGVYVVLEEEAQRAAKVFSFETMQKVIALLVLIPNGIQTMSMDIPGLVESSTNLGVVSTKEEEVIMVSALRSSIVTLKEAILFHMQHLSKILGVTLSTYGDYPAWEYNPNSSVRQLFENVFEKLYGKKPLIEAIHAGLECGFFAQKIQGVDMISFGPNMWDVHTPDERLSISSTARMWEYLLAVLKEMK